MRYLVYVVYVIFSVCVCVYTWVHMWTRGDIRCLFLSFSSLDFELESLPDHEVY